MRKLFLEIVNAANLMPKDGQGSSSPYCVAEYDGQMHQTEVKKKSLNPVWNTVMEFTVHDHTSMDAHVLDLNIYSAKKPTQQKPSFLGRVRITGANFAKKGEEALVFYKLRKRGVFSQIKGEIGLKVWWMDEPDPPPPEEPAPPAPPEAPPAEPAPSTEQVASEPAPSTEQVASEPAPDSGPAPSEAPEPEVAPLPEPPAPEVAPPPEPPAPEVAPPPEPPAPEVAPPPEPPAVAPEPTLPPAEPEPEPHRCSCSDEEQEDAKEDAPKQEEYAPAEPEGAPKKDDAPPNREDERIEVIERKMMMQLPPVYWDHNFPYAYEAPWNNFIPTSVLENPYINLSDQEWITWGATATCKSCHCPHTHH